MPLHPAALNKPTGVTDLRYWRKELLLGVKSAFRPRRGSSETRSARPQEPTKLFFAGVGSLDSFVAASISARSVPAASAGMCVLPGA